VRENESMLRDKVWRGQVLQNLVGSETFCTFKVVLLTNGAGTTGYLCAKE